MTGTIATLPSRALDLGSGAGVPGLVLAVEWPDSTWVLLDAGERRTTVLQQAVIDLGVGSRVTVICGRAEGLGHDPAHRGTYDLVTSRSFGPPAVTAECGAPFLRVGGVLAVTEPPDEQPRWPAEGLAELGLVAGHTTEAPRTQQLIASAPCPDRYPRRIGIPVKRPLF